MRSICTIDLWEPLVCNWKKSWLRCRSQNPGDDLQLGALCKMASVIPDTFMGGSRLTSAISRVGSHPISGIAEATFIHRSPRHSSHSRYISHEAMVICPCVGRPRHTFTSIPILSISPSQGMPTLTRSVLLALTFFAICVQRGQRIFGSLGGPHRCPSTQHPAYNFL